MRSRTGRSIFYSIGVYLFISSSIFIFPRDLEKNFLGFTSFFSYLMVFFLSIFGSCELFTSEIKENTIQFLFTKPLKPREIILSKWICLNFVILTTLLLYLIIFHIAGLAIFQKYFFKMDLSFFTIFLSGIILSSFTFLLLTIYPSVATGVFIIIFGTGLIDFFLKSLIDTKTHNFFGFLAKKTAIFILYILFYIFPSHSQISLGPDEILLNKTFIKNYSNYIFYAIFGTIFYLLLSIYIFGIKRRSYFKSI